MNEEQFEAYETPRKESKAMQAAERLPHYVRQFRKIEIISDLIGDLADAFAGKPLNYEREFTANTRTALAGQIMVQDDLNFQAYRPEELR